VLMLMHQFLGIPQRLLRLLSKSFRF